MPVLGMSFQSTRAEGKVGQDRQFLCGVAAVDVHRRIGLGKAQLLRLGQGAGIAHTAILHLREDEVARAVQNAVDRLDLVGHQRLIDGRDHRNPPSHGRLKGNRATHAAGAIE